MRHLSPFPCLVLICVMAFAGCKKPEDDMKTRLMTWAAPQHPYLAANGSSNLHNDAYMTDVYKHKGPGSDNLSITSLPMSRLCITLAFDRAGRMMTLGTGADAKRAIYLINAATMEMLDTYELPAGTDLKVSGAGYFFVDQDDRMVVPVTNRHIYVFTVTDNKFVLQTDYHLTNLEEPCHIASVMPDWTERLWFVTAEGFAGFVNGNGTASVIQLKHLEGATEIKEEIANSFAVDETGAAFIVTDYALYRLEAGEGGQPEIIWREAYDRGTRIKPGQFSQGSGTTPTLISDDFVTITDNAEPRMNVLVYDRKRETEGQRLVCKVPVFGDNASATENSLIAWHNSIIVENNYGYTRAVEFVGKFSEPGMTRIDFTPDGLYEVVWESDVIVPSLVSKYSSGSNIIYTYTKEPDGWYLTGLDMNTGGKIFQVKNGGDEMRFNNHYSGLAIGPDGSAYVACVGGIYRFSE